MKLSVKTVSLLLGLGVSTITGTIVTSIVLPPGLVAAGFGAWMLGSLLGFAIYYTFAPDYEDRGD